MPQALVVSTLTMSTLTEILLANGSQKAPGK
ncbi:MAG: hypothetical protein RLZZ230_605, partial [Candidatus Parcubacteria bacterium]